MAKEIKLQVFECWQNVFKCEDIPNITFNTKEEADEYYYSEENEYILPRTHYLLTYWNEDGTVNEEYTPKFIKANP